jgi:hypothetical protein
METQILTDEQVDQLRSCIEGTQQNVYALAKRLFGSEVEEDVFEQLEKAGAFKCETCNFWQPLDCRSDVADDLCSECERQQGE